MRKYHTYSWKDTNLRISSDKVEAVIAAVKEQRLILENYIERNPEFQTSLEPLQLSGEVPEIVQLMHKASVKTGLGPMAAVAGTLARYGAEAAVAAGAREALVENGGDMYIISDREVIVALYAGENKVGGNLAFRIRPEDMPLALCSSSSKMGHSLSFGSADLVTVCAKDAALADCTATLVANSIKNKDQLDEIVTGIGNSIDDIGGILAVKDDKIALYGKGLPELIRNPYPDDRSRITKDRRSITPW